MSGGASASLICRGRVSHVRPLSVERSTEIATGAPYWCAGSKFVTVVYTAPSGATCGRRYVEPCGVWGGSGSGCGVDQAVWLPSGRASAYETYGTGVTVWKFTHIV